MFLCSFEHKCNSSLSLVNADYGAGCFLEPLLGDLDLCLQGKFEDSLLFPDLIVFQKIAHDCYDTQFAYKVHELFFLHYQDATLLV